MFGFSRYLLIEHPCQACATKNRRCRCDIILDSLIHEKESISSRPGNFTDPFNVDLTRRFTIAKSSAYDDSIAYDWAAFTTAHQYTDVYCSILLTIDEIKSQSSNQSTRITELSSIRDSTLKNIDGTSSVTEGETKRQTQ